MSEWWMGLEGQVSAAALEAAAHDPHPEDALVEAAGAQAVLEVRARFYHMPYVMLEDFRPDIESVRLLGEDVARRLGVLPLFQEGHTLYLAVADADDVAARDFVQNKTGLEVEPVIVLSRPLAEVTNRVYLTPDMMAGQMARFEASTRLPPEVEDTHAEMVVASAPAVTMVETLLAQGIRLGASDIHLEPYETHSTLRYRIDGVLHEYPAPPHALTASIVSRIKILSNMDVAQRRIPQDGRCNVEVGGVEYDLRVSVIPNQFAEAVVIRILSGRVASMELDDLGFSPALLERWKHLVSRSYGIVLVTGPTGSGKTTTLYATMQHIRRPDRKLVTIEDPIEYRLAGILQFPVHSDAGMSFASILRAVLRHDPDIIMLGEVRDLESAEITLRASLTGHLVLSTLHTNDAPTAVARLFDMGIPSYLVLATLNGVLAQRLVRRLCERYREARPVTAEERQLLGLGPDVDTSGVCRPGGCEVCHHLGYQGRIAIYELLELNQAVRHAARQDMSPLAIRAAARRLSEEGKAPPYTSLRDSANQLLLAGMASLEDVLASTELEDMSVIYLGEDSLLHQELVAATLQSIPDIQLKCFSDGLELYLEILRNPPDILLLDIILPSLSGLALSGLLKHHGRYQSIPIIMISSMVEAGIDERVQRAGAEVFLHKPYEPADLVRAVQRFMRGSGDGPERPGPHAVEGLGPVGKTGG